MVVRGAVRFVAGVDELLGGTRGRTYALNDAPSLCPASAECMGRLILTNPWLIPHIFTINPTNPTNPDLKIHESMLLYLKIRINRISGISRLFEWDSSRICWD